MKYGFGQRDENRSVGNMVEPLNRMEYGRGWGGRRVKIPLVLKHWSTITLGDEKGVAWE